MVEKNAIEDLMELALADRDAEVEFARKEYEAAMLKMAKDAPPDVLSMLSVERDENGKYAVQGIEGGWQLWRRAWMASCERQMAKNVVERFTLVADLQRIVSQVDDEAAVSPYTGSGFPRGRQG